MAPRSLDADPPTMMIGRGSSLPDLDQSRGHVTQPDRLARGQVRGYLDNAFPRREKWGALFITNPYLRVLTKNLM